MVSLSGTGAPRLSGAIFSPVERISSASSGEIGTSGFCGPHILGNRPPSNGVRPLPLKTAGAVGLRPRPGTIRAYAFGIPLSAAASGPAGRNNARSSITESVARHVAAPIDEIVHLRLRSNCNRSFNNVDNKLALARRLVVLLAEKRGGSRGI